MKKWSPFLDLGARSPIFGHLKMPKVATLTDMGFPRERVEEALRQTNNEVDQAIDVPLVGVLSAGGVIFFIW